MQSPFARHRCRGCDEREDTIADLSMIVGGLGLAVVVALLMFALVSVELIK